MVTEFPKNLAALLFEEQEHKGHDEPQRTQRDVYFRRVRCGSLCSSCSCIYLEKLSNCFLFTFRGLPFASKEGVN
jgi:hypothetical protein